jgi:hypothetical protein
MEAEGQVGTVPVGLAEIEHPLDAEDPIAPPPLNPATLVAPEIEPEVPGSKKLAGFWADNRRGLLFALIGTVALRLVTEMIGLVSRYGSGFPRLVVKKPGLLLSVWSRWDAITYLSIAQHGYAGKTVGHGQVANGIALAPLYPFAIRLSHWATHLSFLASAEALSALALFVALATLHRLATQIGGPKIADTSLLLLLAFPTAFFLLAPYPLSLALALTLFACITARRGQWLVAGLLAAAAALTSYYLMVIVLVLAVEVWHRRQERKKGGQPGGSWEHEVIRLSAVSLPTLAAMGLFMAYQQSHLGNAYAFVHAQQLMWHRHIAAPWTLFHHTVLNVLHWQFAHDGVAGVTEAFDLVSVILLAAAAVYAFLRIRRSYGVLLGLCWCVFTFQTFLLSVSRELLVLFPLFLCGGMWTSRRLWRERALLVVLLPCAYFLIQRFVTGAFAG